MRTRLTPALVLVAALAAGCAGTTSDAPTTPGAAATTSADTAPADYVGQPLDVAERELMAAGWLVEVYDAVDGKAVILRTNWTVTEQEVVDGRVRLGAKKNPAPTKDTSDEIDGEKRAADVLAYLEQTFDASPLTDYLATDATSWVGYVSGVRVERGNLVVTIQENDKALGKAAAQALSTLLTADLVDGIGHVIVENSAGVVLAQKQPKPLA